MRLSWPGWAQASRKGEGRFFPYWRRALLRRAGSWTLAATILVTSAILAIVLQPLLRGEVSSGLMFVLGITLVGATSGLIPALVAALAASAIFNFFLADPVLTFRISTGDDLAPPVIFTLCALVSGLLAGRLKDKTFQLGHANLQLESLLETSRMLQAAPDMREVQAVLRRTVPSRLGFTLSLFAASEGDVQALSEDADRPQLLTLARESLSGDGVATNGSAIAHRLDGSRSCVGALVIENPGRRRLDRAFVAALASLVGLALERAQFASVIAENEANARTEELKSALLSSVSHDLRTPLTAISASASSLIEFGNRLDVETSRSLLQGIVDECDRLNRFTANLLELSRLQSAGPGLPGQVLSIADVIRTVVQRLQVRDDHDIRVSAPRHDVLVVADTALFELALTNVIQNAMHYGEADSPILVEAREDGSDCVISVTDQGCGIPECEQSRVFERFYRVRRAEASPHGSGLGLAIAKGFVEAFGGSIELFSPVSGGRGTRVSIRLPVFRGEIAA